MMDENTIQEMGNRPYAAPVRADIIACCSGMPYAASARTNATASAVSAAIHAGLRRTPSITNRTAIGIEATSADRARLAPTGS